jgi:hypothetical protein
MAITSAIVNAFFILALLSVGIKKQPCNAMSSHLPRIVKASGIAHIDVNQYSVNGFIPGFSVIE